MTLYEFYLTAVSDYVSSVNLPFLQAESKEKEEISFQGLRAFFHNCTVCGQENKAKKKKKVISHASKDFNGGSEKQNN